MNGLGIFKSALVALALVGFSAPQAEAIEIVGGSSPAFRMNEGLISTVAMHRGGGGHRGGGMHHGGMHHGGMHRGGGVHYGSMHRPGVPGHRPGHHPGYRPGHPGYRPGYRPGYHPGYRPGYGAWVRPGSYGWPAGGAIAAGAAIGFVSAASAAAWAGTAPGPGLCWYYTDPSRRQGFWDACP
jgi:hypothetical protein